MKKILALVVVVILGALLYAATFEKTFDAEKILQQSALKERTFSAEVKEISGADDAKVKAYLMEEHSLPLVAVSFGFDKSGMAYEEKIGTALLAENVLLDGAGDYSRKELREVMKEKGIKIGINAGQDRLSFSLSYVKEFEKEAWQILKAVLYQPRLEEEDLDLARRQLSAARRQRLENPSYHLAKLVDEHFYKEHPYGRENIPDDEILASVTADDISAYLKAGMGKENLKVGISGDMDAKESALFLKEIFGELPERGSLFEIKPFVPDFKEDEAYVNLDTSAQSFVLLAAKGIKRLDKDFYPLYIADYIFGGSGLNSRLNKAVREEQGLTYGIYSYFTNSDAVDLWQIYFSATPENAEKAMAITQNEYQKFYDEGVSAAELEQAKKALLSSFNLRFSSLFNVAQMLELMQVQELGKDFLLKRQRMVEEVNLSDVNRAIREKMPKFLNKSGGVRLFEVIGAKK